MKTSIKILGSLLIIILTFTNQTQAQQKAKVTTQDKNGLTTVTFETKKGTVTTHLPSNLYAGDVISGTVIAEPTGKNEKKITKNKNVLNGYVVEFEEKKTPVSQGKEKWKLPAETGEIAKLILKDQEGEILGGIELPVNNKPRTTYVPETLENSDFDIPSYIRAGEPERITGLYDGDFSTSAVNIDDEPVEILAESPEGIYFETPEDVTGPVEVELTEGDFTMEEQTNVLDLELSADKLALTKGEQTEVHIIVTGLDSLEEEVPLEITNLTPENITMEGGDEQQIIIEPEDVNEEGEFNYNVDVSAIGTGGFSISTSIQPDTLRNYIPNKKNRPENEIKIPIDGKLSNLTSIDFSIPLKNTMEVKLPNEESYLADYLIDSNILFQLHVDIPNFKKRILRNQGRGIDEDTPLGPTDPDDHSLPHSRPVPAGIRSTPYSESHLVWRDTEQLLDKAKKEVRRALGHTGDISTGVPGYSTIGILYPSEEIRYRNRKCTEKVYILTQTLYYVNDRTLVLEEQLSPSFEFFVAQSENTINITRNESGWSVSPSISAGINGISMGISGSYWNKTEHITGRGTSDLQGRQLRLFHIGRLYLARKAYLRIFYEYHYEICDNGTTRNWVDVTYTDNWYYCYEWEEELFAAAKDDEGNYHRVSSFPSTIHLEKLEENHHSYEVYGLEPDDFETFGNFFPPIRED